MLPHQRAWLLAIGRRLRADYDATAEPIPPRLAELVKQLERPVKTSNDDAETAPLVARVAMTILNVGGGGMVSNHRLVLFTHALCRLSYPATLRTTPPGFKSRLLRDPARRSERSSRASPSSTPLRFAGAASEHPSEAAVFQHACKAGSRGDRFQAAGIALPLRAIAGLAKVQESGSAGGEASGGRGLGSLIITTRERRGLR